MFMAERAWSRRMRRSSSASSTTFCTTISNADTITACCAIFDAPTRVLSYANAGHPPALLLRATEPRCTTIDADGLLLGIRKDVHFMNVKVRLQTSDIVVFYTDGIIEMRNPPAKRLARTASARRWPPIAPRIPAAWSPGSGGIGCVCRGLQAEDDITLVVMKLTCMTKLPR